MKYSLTRGRCRSCTQPILWGKTEKFANMPIDVDKVPNGNLDINGDGLLIVVTPSPTLTRWVSHFTTCPNAKDHRRKP